MVYLCLRWVLHNKIKDFLALWNLQIGENSFKIVRTYTNNFERLRLEVVKEEHIKQGIMTLEKEEGIEVEGAGAKSLVACLYNPKLQNDLFTKRSKKIWEKNLVATNRIQIFKLPKYLPHFPLSSLFSSQCCLMLTGRNVDWRESRSEWKFTLPKL